MTCDFLVSAARNVVEIVYAYPSREPHSTNNRRLEGSDTAVYSFNLCQHELPRELL